MGNAMKAALCREFGQPLTIEDVHLRGPLRDEAEVTIEACAVCHSDIHYMEGAWGGTLPVVYGHEAAGRISALGTGISDLAVGDPVLVTLLRNCGECLNCRQGMPARCECKADPNNTPISDSAGNPVARGLNTAAFAERTVVHRTQLAQIPNDMPMDAACLLSCGVITGVGAAVNTARVSPGSSVAVIGAGGVGLNAIQGARISGASTIIAVDISESKLEDARKFGATHGILASTEKPHREVRKLTGGRGVDFALVTVGSCTACETALRFLCQGGELIIAGMPPNGAEMSLQPVIIAGLSQSIKGSCMGDTVLGRDIPWLLNHYRQGRLKVDELITNRFPLARINEAIESTLQGNVRRNVIVFD
ncbi:MAG: Zn-dependent alcohol dehydrogenase [Rhodobacteraceae bacterium]|nr:Zn-dependent alcohol dehydrogenase [Paracoccaceae bacterium]